MSVEEQQEWIVVLECAGCGRRGTAQGAREALSSLMASLARLRPTGLAGSDRYALQLRVVASTAPDALRLATTRWERAQADLQLPRSGLVRAEVLTPEEFEWECDDGLTALSYRSEAVEATDRARCGDAQLSSILRDPHTGLVAWDLLRHHLEYVVASSGADRTHALVLVDVQRDGRGLSEPDLNPVARQLESLLRSADIVARVTDSRFAVLLEDTSEQAAAAIAHRLAVGLEARAGICPSMGFDLSEPGDDGCALYARAAAALARACATGSPERFDRPQSG
ncbi:MAG: diguanylate cyclase domain-containing protein [Acidimicrobiia bacterium]